MEGLHTHVDLNNPIVVNEIPFEVKVVRF